MSSSSKHRRTPTSLAPRPAAPRTTSMAIATACAIALLSASAGAQATTPPPKPPEQPTGLGTVVVTATRGQTKLEKMPLHTTVITQTEIRKSPAQTLDQLLRQIPSFNLSGAPYYTTDPTGHQTKMRGVSNSKVLVLLDGVPIHDPFFVTTQWFKVPLSSIDHVEVVRGGNSSLWGNLAVAGVINIITKKPVDNSGLIAGSYQSMDTYSGSIAKNFVFSHGIAVRISGDVLKAGGYQTTPTEFLSTVPGKAASSATNANAQLAAYFNPTATLSGFLRAGYHEQNERIGGYRFGTNLQKSPDASAGITKLISDKTRAEARAWTQYQTFDKNNGAGCFLVSATTCNTTATASPLVQYANSHDTNPYHELGASAVVSTVALTSKITSLQFGFDTRRIAGEDSATTYNRPTTTDVKSATINRINFGKGTQQFLGGFVQLGVQPLDALDIGVSLRYDYWSNTGGVAEMVRYTGGAAGAKAGGPNADSHKSSFNPSVSARYRISQQLSLRGAAYKAFRSPGLNNLYRSFSSTTSITIANPTLSPETLTGGEAGFDVQTHDFSLGTTYFQYNTKALIASYRVPNAAAAPPAVVAICGATLSNCPASVNFNTNGQDAVSRGLELVTNWHVTKKVNLNGSYTYTDSHYAKTTTGDPTGVQLGAIPQSLVTLGSSLQLTSRWSSYVGLRYSSSMYLDVNKTIGQKAITLGDVSTAYQLNSRVEMYGSVTNAGDLRYVDNATTSASSKTLGMPRAFTGGMRVRF